MNIAELPAPERRGEPRGRPGAGRRLGELARASPRPRRRAGPAAGVRGDCRSPFVICALALPVASSRSVAPARSRSEVRRLPGGRGPRARRRPSRRGSVPRPRARSRRTRRPGPPRRVVRCRSHRQRAGSALRSRDVGRPCPTGRIRRLEADRGGVDDEVELDARLAARTPGDIAAGAELGRERLGLRGGPVPDRHLGARVAQRPDRGPGGSAGAEHERRACRPAARGERRDDARRRRCSRPRSAPSAKVSVFAAPISRAAARGAGRRPRAPRACAARSR